MADASSVDRARGGGLRAAQKEATRRRLLEAAAAVFAMKGYAAATVEDIVRRAGTSPATFYLHFRRKVDVLAAGLEEEERAVWLMSEPLLPGGGLTRERLREWLARLFDTWGGLEASRQLLSQAVLIEPELRALQRRRLVEGIAFWEALLHDLGAPPGPASRAEAALLNAQVFGLFEMWIVHGVDLDAGSLVEAGTDALWDRLTRQGRRAPVD